MSEKTINAATLTVKWKPDSNTVRPTLYPTTGRDANGYLVENITTKIGQIVRYLDDSIDIQKRMMDVGTKNLLPVSSGTSTGLLLLGKTTLKPGDYVFTANMANYPATSTLKFYASSGDAIPDSDITITNDSAVAVEFTISSNDVAEVGLMSTSGTFSNMMIVPAELYSLDSSYTGYVPSNRDLYNMMGNVNTILESLL